MEDTLRRLGKVLNEGEEIRDAVHIAVKSVIANAALMPGARIGLVVGKEDTVGIVDNPIGIVDPFLRFPVYKGQRFLMWLNPGGITSLQHKWTHPAFEKQQDGKN